ncbi:phage tail assembly chaperone [Cohaesibacter marisflavi]
MASQQLGWTPSAIWAATPKELLWALRGPPSRSPSMSREDFQTLSAAFPD